VCERSEATEDTAHRITQEVFAELRHQLPAQAPRSVVSRLPADLLVLRQREHRGRVCGCDVPHAGRIARRAGVRLRHALPAELGDLLASCSGEREEEASQFTADEYLEALATSWMSRPT
jgi:uncharacterized protein (DUF2267 family)